MNTIDTHKKEELWKEIWHLSNPNKSTRYKGTAPKLKKELKALFLELLNQKRELPPALPIITGLLAPGSQRVKTDLLDISQYPLYQADPVNWIPWAKDAKSGAKRGRYRNGGPEGIVIHWTAGHRNGLRAGNELMRDTGMLYLLGDEKGNIAQSDSLAYWGYHGGPSVYPGLPGTVSNELIGLEQQAGGMLTKKGNRFYTWFGKVVPKGEVIEVKRKKGNMAAGYYHMFTQAQMLSTVRTCVWLKLNNPSVFKIHNIVGHDDVSPGRKTDPGGALHENGKPMTTEQLREIVAAVAAVVVAKQRRAGL